MLTPPSAATFASTASETACFRLAMKEVTLASVFSQTTRTFFLLLDALHLAEPQLQLEHDRLDPLLGDCFLIPGEVQAHLELESNGMDDQETESRLQEANWSDVLLMPGEATINQWDHDLFHHDSQVHCGKLF